MKHKKASKGIFVDVAVLIVCLAIATSCLASGMFAKFVSKSAGADLARVASFNVDAKLNQTDYTVDLAEQTNGNPNEASYVLALTNNSDIAVRYTIVLSFNNSVEGVVKTALIGSTPAQVEDGKIFIWEGVGTIKPNDSAAPVIKLTIDGAPADQTFDFSINVTFTQVN